MPRQAKTRAAASGIAASRAAIDGQVAGGVDHPVLGGEAHRRRGRGQDAQPGGRVAQPQAGTVPGPPRRDGLAAGAGRRGGRTGHDHQEAGRRGVAGGVPAGSGARESDGWDRNGHVRSLSGGNRGPGLCRGRLGGADAQSDQVAGYRPDAGAGGAGQAHVPFLVVDADQHEDQQRQDAQRRSGAPRWPRSWRPGRWCWRCLASGITPFGGGGEPPALWRIALRAKLYAHEYASRMPRAQGFARITLRAECLPWSGRGRNRWRRCGLYDRTVAAGVRDVW